MYRISPASIFAIQLLNETVHGHYHSWLTWYRKDLMPGAQRGDRGMTTTPQMRLPPPPSVFDELVQQGLCVKEEQAPQSHGPPLTRWISRVALTRHGVAAAELLRGQSTDSPVEIDPRDLEPHLPDEEQDAKGR